ncbi:MAG: FHA domain-containing protein [Myxococcota bacterium]|nr:FHA domain-containing protein [Myxococcota bacterium]
MRAAQGTLGEVGVVRGDIGQRITLGPRTVVGRSRACTIRLSESQVSGEHACVFWHRGAWWLRDLGSTNGTWIDGRRVEVGARVELQRDAVLGIGDADGATLTLVDDAAPLLRAIDARSGVVREGSTELLYLPDDDDPRATIFDDGTGWIVEREGAVLAALDQQPIEVDGTTWTLELPARASDDDVDTTAAAGDGLIVLERSLLRFRVSRDEEYVELTVIASDREIALTPRAFHYLLLTLARKRAADAAAQVEPAEQGWIYADELARQLATTKPKLNLDICRARQQLAAAGIGGAARIIERRASTHQLRLGASELHLRTFD